MSTTTGTPPACVTASRVATNVMAGTMTSSPGSRPDASNPNRRASSPLATPTQYGLLQYDANSRSNVATWGPLVNAPLSSNSSRSARSRGFSGACIKDRSRNGTETACASSAGCADMHRPYPDRYGTATADGPAFGQLR